MPEALETLESFGPARIRPGLLMSWVIGAAIGMGWPSLGLAQAPARHVYGRAIEAWPGLSESSAEALSWPNSLIPGPSSAPKDKHAGHSEPRTSFSPSGIRPTGVPPVNDAFANATMLSGSSLVAMGSNVMATKEAGEPDHAGIAGGASVWWAWTAPTSFYVRIDTFGSGFDTLLAVYTGVSVAELTEVASNDDSGSPRSRVRFLATAGTIYRIAVDGFAFAMGAITLNLGPAPPPSPNDFLADEILLDVASGTTTGFNLDATKEGNEPDHAGSMGGKSVWWFWRAEVSGTQTFDTFGSTFDTLLGIYTGTEVSNLALVAHNDDFGDPQSRVTFTTTAGTTYRIAVDGFSGASGTIVLNWEPGPPPPGNDAFTDAISLSGANGTTHGINVGATKEADEPFHGGQFGGASVWWSWTAPTSADAQFNTFGSPFDTVLAIYAGAGVSNLTPVAVNDDYADNVLQSLVTFAATAGTTYRIAVDGFGGLAGAIVLNWGSPVNDAFADGIPLDGASGTTTGFNIGATKEPGEPNHAGNMGGKTVWWTWTAPDSGLAIFDTFGSHFDTLLAVYTGSDVSNLILVADNDDFGVLIQSRVTFMASAGTSYRIAVDGFFTLGGAFAGPIILNWGPPANDAFANALAISGPTGTTAGNNLNASKEPGEPDHAGDAGGASVWWSWTAPASGFMPINTFGSEFNTLLAVYTGSDVAGLTPVADNDQAGSSDQSQVVIFAEAGTTYRIAVDGASGVTGSIWLNWGPPLSPTPTPSPVEDRLLVWARRAGGADREQGRGIAALLDGGAAVTGFFRGSATFGPDETAESMLASAGGTEDIFLARYRADGALVWARRGGGTSFDRGLSVASLADGSLLLTGDFTDAATFGPGESGETMLTAPMGSADVFIARYNPEDGALTWVRQAGGSGDDRGFGIAARPDGGSFVTGVFSLAAVFGPGEIGQVTLDSAGSSDIFIARYDPDGALVWARRAGGSGSDGGTGVVALPDGDAVVNGAFEDLATFGLGESGETTLASDGPSDIFIARYRANGTLAWARRAGGRGQDWGVAAAAVADGGAVLTGTFEATATFGAGERSQTVFRGETVPPILEPALDMFIARYRPDGTLAWARRAGGLAPDVGWGIAALPDGGAVVTGQFYLWATFGPGESAQTILASAGLSDVFVARYNSDGTLAWARQAGGASDDAGLGVAALSSGGAIVTGGFKDQATFGPGEGSQTLLTSAGDADIFVARFTSPNAIRRWKLYD